MFFCRVAKAEISEIELRCESCPLYNSSAVKGSGEACVYEENGEEFPDLPKGKYGPEYQILEKAFQFAAVAHKGASRKGSKVPYILHPMEAAMTTLTMTGDIELAAAAALHDVIEDTEYTYEDLLKQFGKRVADVVQEESENKHRDMTPEQSWKIRKEEGIERISKAPYDAQVVALADKLSNMRATHRDYLRMSDEVFQRFHNTDKSAHAWYHKGLLGALGNLKEFPQYQEYESLYQAVFGQE